MKKLANLKGVKMLNKNEQKSITGGKIKCGEEFVCRPQYCCVNGVCYPCMLV